MTTREQLKADEGRVIAELIRDPRQEIGRIAEKCGMSKQKVWRIVRSLEGEGAIMSRPASLNPKKMGKRSFLILFERSFKTLDDSFLSQMTLHEFKKEIAAEDIKAVVEESYYINGVYDWAFILTVEEHRDLIRFMELWRKHYGEYFSKVIQSEITYVLIRNSVLNPNLSEIRDLVK